MPRRQHRDYSFESEDNEDETRSLGLSKRRRIKHHSRHSSVQAEQHGINTAGLPTFPDELLFEILSHLPTAPMPNAGYGPLDAECHIVRQQSLLTLSLTCSNLRRFFRPYVWNRIEIISSKGRTSNLELLRQLEVVTVRDPSLAQYVEVVNVHVRDYSVVPVVEELARCIAIFPNLHSVKLQISFNPAERPFGYRSEVSKIFSSRSYPQIRSIFVSKSAYGLLASCPEVLEARNLEVGRLDGWHFLRAISSCHRLENLEIASNMSLQKFQEIPSNFPKVRTLVLHLFRSPHDFSEELECLSNLKHLSHLMIRAEWHTAEARTYIVDWAKALLLDLQRADGEEKYLQLTGQDWPKIEEVDIILPALKTISPINN
ncbi:hypothetical protein CPB84DRAFT_1768428 [Gymnopilus junonius]|uniref:F-box domain-containing protein n=1 Tax=Gymnopilus junonius TaxID=109634 RepID=A0A9P5TRK6_GYMJU|nr:hypothetical protein CPB84DRAFT_1768428 [Gymnopilus junonius]